MKRKPFAKMNADQLAEATREFDGEFEPTFQRPPAPEKRRHDAVLQKIKRGRGRPRAGAGVRRVQITMERTLLEGVDHYARENGLSRSELIARCLRPVVSRRSA